MPGKVTLFSSTTADKVLKKVGVLKSSPQPPRTAGNEKVRRLIEIVTSDGDGYYTVKAKTLDNTDSDPAYHTMADLVGDEFTAREITGSTSAEVGQTYPAWLDTAQEGSVFHFQLGGGGSTRSLIMLQALSTSGEVNEWKADIIDDRTNQTVEESNVTVYAPNMLSGTLPTTGTDPARFWRADKVTNSENIADANGGPTPPDNIYEIHPNVWY